MYEGKCQCGVVGYRLRGEPLTSYACHCTECQAATGSAFSLTLILPREAIEETRGEAACSEYELRGRRMQRQHCASCGSALWFAAAGMPDICALKAGTLADRAAFPPIAHVWTRSARAWFPLPDGVPLFPEQPDLDTLLALWRERRASA